jgi:hypothetical protein
MITSYLLIALVITAAAAITTTNDVQASSIVGEYARGYEDGKENGADDYYDGNNRDSRCPSGSGLSYCTGYKIGYNIGWGAASAIG